MTPAQRVMITHFVRLVVDKEITNNEAVKNICDYIDGEVARAISEACKIGDMLEVVGLEITSKEFTDAK